MAESHIRDWQAPPERSLVREERRAARTSPHPTFIFTLGPAVRD